MGIQSRITALMLACWCTAAAAQGWAPQKNVEIVVGSAPGGSNDRTARFVERMLREHQRARRLHGDVGGESEEGDCDEELGAALSGL